MQARERSCKQRIVGLEQQIGTLKEQLSQEMRARQQYILRSTRAGQEIRQIRSSLDQSLRSVSGNERLDAAALDSESRRLDSTLAGLRGADGVLTPSRLSAPAPAPASSRSRATSPSRSPQLRVPAPSSGRRTKQSSGARRNLDLR
ncbi:uncharacterized protein LOC119114755 [Pollicipes pollicipes]|uniref:uncharacterized protein LOC119114755 n=1 Tax=Pollicipes pollicipes TaxID=41117 RepID=UPI0018858F1C|nr:uncharacterized protein LOC119114755 [Pollicipes pollicipes]